MRRKPTPEEELFQRGVLVRLSDVGAGYDGPDVLLDLDFEARAGEVAFVSGPTSAGKTTLIHLLRLALRPRAGNAIILGVDVQRLNAGRRARLKQQIGYISESPVFVEDWTGSQNIGVALKLAGRRRRDYEDDVRELADFVGLGDAAEQPLRELSGAQRRRVAIARALAAKPDLILADDPTAGLSPEAGRRVVRLLGEMRRVGAGIVITTQDADLAYCIPDAHCWRIERGRLSPVADAAEVEA